MDITAQLEDWKSSAWYRRRDAASAGSPGCAGTMARGDAGARRHVMDERPGRTWRRPLPAGLRPDEGGGMRGGSPHDS